VSRSGGAPSRPRAARRSRPRHPMILHALTRGSVTTRAAGGSTLLQTLLRQTVRAGAPRIGDSRLNPQMAQ
jgi:hypothetical protein